MVSTEFLNKLSDLIHKVDKTSIIENSFFILGAGKFGRNAIQYAMKQPEDPYILIIDKEINSQYTEFQTATNITNIHEVISSDSRRYYLQKDIGIVADILQYGFPESLIPAVPIHAVAYIIEKLYSSLQPETPLRLSVSHSIWADLMKSIPKQVVLQEDQETGVILLSWAKMDELCPSHCEAPLNYCPHHHREKPQTITEISQNIALHNISNYTLESHQVQPGLGLILGEELKHLILNCLNQIKQNLSSNQSSEFIVSTTCNCHGVINVFSLCA